MGRFNLERGAIVGIQSRNEVFGVSLDVVQERNAVLHRIRRQVLVSRDDESVFDVSVLELAASPGEVVIGGLIEHDEVDVVEIAAGEEARIVQVQHVVAGVARVGNGIAADVVELLVLLILPIFGECDGLVS